jgi:hypothetical protein
MDEGKNLHSVSYLKQSLDEGGEWYPSLLKSISLEETLDDYLIDNEALDLLSLCERLCREVDGQIPEEEKLNFLFYGIPPQRLCEEELKELLGEEKYNAYLNWFYGVVVEQALILVTEEELRKQKGAFQGDEKFIQDEVYRRIYGYDIDTLFLKFWEERDSLPKNSISLREANEFIYWLFKYRLKQSSKPKIASDTKRALEYLKKLVMSQV